MSSPAVSLPTAQIHDLLCRHFEIGGCSGIAHRINPPESPQATSLRLEFGHFSIVSENCVLCRYCIWPDIPTGFRLKAQGCEARATLGNRRQRAQPQRGCVSILLLQPLVGDALKFFDPLGLGNRAAKTRQQVNVLFHSPTEDGRAIEPFGNLSQICVQALKNLLVPKKWTAVFGGEDELNINDRKRLWHRISFMFGRNPVGVVTSGFHLPRVARFSQPWALGRNPFGISSRICPNSSRRPRACDTAERKPPSRTQAELGGRNRHEFAN